MHSGSAEEHGYSIQEAFQVLQSAQQTLSRSANDQSITGITETLRSVGNLLSRGSNIAEELAGRDIGDVTATLRQFESIAEQRRSTLQSKRLEIDAARRRISERTDLTPEEKAERYARLDSIQSYYDAAQRSTPQMLQGLQFARQLAEIVSPKVLNPSPPASDSLVLQGLHENFGKGKNAMSTQASAMSVQEGCEKIASFAHNNPGGVLNEKNVKALANISEKMAESQTSNRTSTDPFANLEALRGILREGLTDLDFTNLMHPETVAEAKRHGLYGNQNPLQDTLQRMRSLMPQMFGEVSKNMASLGQQSRAHTVSQAGNVHSAGFGFLLDGMEDLKSEMSKVERHIADPDIEMYEYDELRVPTSVRLLRINDVEDELIHCSLDVVDLGNPSGNDFVALSYVWGDHRSPSFSAYHPERAQRKFPIICNDRKLLVTLNLCRALKALFADSGDDASRTYWIDQICINQENNPEKSSQVAMMDRIYRSAKQVVGWLGPSDQFIENASKLVKHLASIRESEYTREGYDVRAEIGRHSIGEWQCLVATLSRSYFSRAWIVQEVLLNDKIRFLCGEHELSWNDLNKSSEFLTRTNAWNLIAQHARSTAGLARDKTSVFSSLEHYRVLTATKKQFQEGDNPRLDLMFLGRNFHASNARDHAIGILGLLKHRFINRPLSSCLPVVHYGKSVTQVFTEFAKLYVEQSNSLDILSHVEDEACRTHKELPSWVPDLSTPMRPLPLRAEKDECKEWSPASDLKFEGVELVQELDAIKCRGILIDRIEAVAEPFDDNAFWRSAFLLINQIRCCKRDVPRPDLSLLRALVVEPAKYTAEVQNDDYPGFICWLIDAIYRLKMSGSLEEMATATGNQSLNMLPGLMARTENLREDVRVDKASTAEAMLKDLVTRKTGLELSGSVEGPKMEARLVFQSTVEELAKLKGTDYLLPQHTENLHIPFNILSGPDSQEKTAFIKKLAGFQTAVGTNTEHRRLFRTAEYRLGMGPLSLRQDDSIWILPGAAVPFVLRRLDSSHYKVVGEAYINGIMHGEVVSEHPTLEDIYLGRG